MTALSSIPPQQAAAMIRDGAVLVDIREADERARERFPGARHHALSRLEGAPIRQGEEILIFHCRSGVRTRGHAGRLAQAAGCEAYLIEGGLQAWKEAGLPVAVDRRQPIELMRQVQTVTGGLVLAGAGLGFALDPAFHLVAALVGAGILFAGLFGFCGMARLLAAMPWNRRAAAS